MLVEVKVEIRARLVHTRGKDTKESDNPEPTFSIVDRNTDVYCSQYYTYQNDRDITIVIITDVINEEVPKNASCHQSVNGQEGRHDDEIEEPSLFSYKIRKTMRDFLQARA